MHQITVTEYPWPQLQKLFKAKLKKDNAVLKWSQAGFSLLDMLKHSESLHIFEEKYKVDVITG